jgi:L,D-peptidoglycan transpeptidase YkuD (ErfK/YbiS/YcfS/YnhG family)
MLAATMLAVPVGLMPAGPARAAAVKATPTAAARAPAVSQLIMVTAVSRTTTYATFRAYQVTGTKRVLVFGPWTARVGYDGIAAPGRKREGDGRTPSGTYGFSFFFGVDPSPGVAFPYRHAYSYDYWDDDPASPRYNEWVDAKTANPGRNPEMMQNIPAYDYAAVIAFNTARTPGLGSAIFLHVGTGTATAGCVSLPAAELLRVLRWLRPPDDPRISISAALGGQEGRRPDKAEDEETMPGKRLHRVAPAAPAPAGRDRRGPLR